MGILEDILKALDRIPNWKRIQELPSEVGQLTSRIAALEEKLGGKWPADVCKFCGERALRLKNSLGPNERGNMHEDWKCSACDQYETRIKKPS